MTQKWVGFEGITHFQLLFLSSGCELEKSSNDLYGTRWPEVSLQTNPFVTTVRRFGWNSHIQNHSGQIYRGNTILFDRLPKVIYLHYVSSAEFDFLWHLFCLSRNPVLSALSFRAHIEKAHWQNTWSTYSTWNKGSWDILEVWWLLKNEPFPFGLFPIFLQWHFIN